ncbi:MAG: hypothetical protein ACLRXQ_12375 [Phascolarctobacterium faecium]
MFSFGTVTDVIEKDGKLYAPGICDARALAANLSVIRLWSTAACAHIMIL